jgi:hypothetical protein
MYIYTLSCLCCPTLTEDLSRPYPVSKVSCLQKGIIKATQKSERKALDNICLDPIQIDYWITRKCWTKCVSFYVIKTNLMHYITSVYFVNQPVHVSGIFVAHHQEVYCICTVQQLVRAVLFSWLSVGRPANRQSTKKHNTYQFLYIYSIPPDDWLQICPKHVQVDWRNKLRINGASSWFSLHACIEMHGQRNVKFTRPRIRILSSFSSLRP